MKFMGSKNRHAKDIIPMFALGNQSAYVEPFVGGANLIDKISGHRIAGDIDKDLICMWQAVSGGWMPPAKFTEQEYKDIKDAPTSPLRGYAAFALSYGGKKFGGWRRDKDGQRDYVSEAYRNAAKQFPLLRGTKFFECSYRELRFPTGSVVYCDPPYAGTTSYGGQFSHNDFWDWVRIISKVNWVFISEYSAPLDFKRIWTKTVPSSLTKNTGGKSAHEGLYVLRT